LAPPALVLLGIAYFRPQWIGRNPTRGSRGRRFTTPRADRTGGAGAGGSARDDRAVLMTLEMGSTNPIHSATAASAPARE
jgi:hypothetical protein